MTAYALSEISPNPFRHVDRYPINQEKVAQLRASIRETGFWDNVVARVGAAGPEIAYGHHRLEAAKQELGPDHEIDLIVRDLSDEMMLKIMANENMEEWRTSFSVIMETVEAVVEAYGANQIELETPNSITRGDGNWKGVRDAPNFVCLDSSSRSRVQNPYTPRTVARFLGWVKANGEALDGISPALLGRELIDEGRMKKSEIGRASCRERV